MIADCAHYRFVRSSNSYPEPAQIQCVHCDSTWHDNYTEYSRIAMTAEAWQRMLLPFLLLLDRALNPCIYHSPEAALGHTV